jgi:hypothetical protein
MKIRGNNDWFEVTGEINVNEDHVLNCVSFWPGVRRQHSSWRLVPASSSH